MNTDVNTDVNTGVNAVTRLKQLGKSLLAYLAAVVGMGLMGCAGYVLVRTLYGLVLGVATGR